MKFGVRGSGFSDVRGPFLDVRGSFEPILVFGRSGFWTFGVRGFWTFGVRTFGVHFWTFGVLLNQFLFLDVRGLDVRGLDVRGSGFGVSDVRGSTPNVRKWTFGVFGRSGFGRSGLDPERPN